MDIFSLSIVYRSWLLTLAVKQSFSRRAFIHSLATDYQISLFCLFIFTHSEVSVKQVTISILSFHCCDFLLRGSGLEEPADRTLLDWPTTNHSSTIFDKSHDWSDIDGNRMGICTRGREPGQLFIEPSGAYLKYTFLSAGHKRNAIDTDCCRWKQTYHMWCGVPLVSHVLQTDALFNSVCRMKAPPPMLYRCWYVFWGLSLAYLGVCETVFNEWLWISDFVVFPNREWSEVCGGGRRAGMVKGSRGQHGERRRGTGNEGGNESSEGEWRGKLG